MSGKIKFQRRKWYSFTASEMGKALVLAAVLLVIIFFIADSNWPRHYYVSEIQLCNTTVVEKVQEDGKFYVHVSNSGISQPILSDDLWFEVKLDFFQKININSPVGVSIGKNDAYKTRMLVGGHRLESSTWGVLEIYSSYEEAEKANQTRKYSSEALLESKVLAKDGMRYFTLKAEERSFTLEVSEQNFSKYSVNQKMNCNFEAVGEFVKLIGIVE